LEEKIEGWVTGLRLAALSMRHRGNLDPSLLEPQVDAQYVMEYLFTEVFETNFLEPMTPESVKYRVRYLNRSFRLSSNSRLRSFSTANPKSQKNDIPPSLIVQDGLNEKKQI
jgi:hypothetical protein